MRARQRAQHHIERIHGGVQRRLQRGDRGAHLGQRAFGLPDLQFGRQPFAVQQIDGGQQLLLGLNLPARDIQRVCRPRMLM
jgi:hypothetical protein